MLTPITTAITAIPDRAPRGIRDPRRGLDEVAGRRPPDSCSMAAAVLAQRSRGGSGAVVTKGAKREPIRCVLRGDARTGGAVREVLVEPGGLLETESAGHPLGEP